MQCESIQEMLSAYLDDEVSGAERKQISTHLAYCERCREALSALAAVDEMGRRPYVEDPGRVYWQRLNRDIKTAVDRAEATSFMRKRRRSWRFQPLFAAGLAAAAVLVFFVGRRITEEHALTPLPSEIRDVQATPEALRGKVAEKEAAVPVVQPPVAMENQVPKAKADSKEGSKGDVKQTEKRRQQGVKRSGRQETPLRGGAAHAEETPSFFTVDRVAAPAARKVAVSGEVQRASIPQSGAAQDTLAERIHALERGLAAVTDSLKIRTVRVQQARLHYARARQRMTAEAIREARLFYLVYKAWLSAPPDSSQLADYGQRLAFLLRTLEKQ